MFGKEEGGSYSNKDSVVIHHPVRERTRLEDKRNKEGNINMKEKVKYWEPIHRGFKKYMIHSRAKYYER